MTKSPNSPIPQQSLLPMSFDQLVTAPIKAISGTQHLLSKNTIMFIRNLVGDNNDYTAESNGGLQSTTGGVEVEVKVKNNDVEENTDVKLSGNLDMQYSDVDVAGSPMMPFMRFNLGGSGTSRILSVPLIALFDVPSLAIESAQIEYSVTLPSCDASCPTIKQNTRYAFNIVLNGNKDPSRGLTKIMDLLVENMSIDNDSDTDGDKDGEIGLKGDVARRLQDDQIEAMTKEIRD